MGSGLEDPGQLTWLTNSLNIFLHKLRALIDRVANFSLPPERSHVTKPSASALFSWRRSQQRAVTFTEHVNNHNRNIFNSRTIIFKGNIRQQTQTMALCRTSGKVVVLGGGISGLAAAWRLSSRIDPARIVLLEGRDVVGGWIRTESTPDGGRFEMGPRSIRPHGKAGIATLDLVRVILLRSGLGDIFRCAHSCELWLAFTPFCTTRIDENFYVIARHPWQQVETHVHEPDCEICWWRRDTSR